MTALVTKHLPLVTEAPGGVNKLRELILELAIRGKLVPQEPTEETAQTLISRIAGYRGASQRKVRVRGAVLRADGEDACPYEIPASWSWCRLVDLVEVLNGRAYKKEELLDNGATPVLRVGNLFTSNHWYYSDLALDSDRYCVAGDLLYAWSASFGPFIWSGERSIYHYHIWKLEPHSDTDLSRRYLHAYLQAQTRAIKAAGHGVSMTHMTKEKMERLAVPVPPLAEQHRIVAKVDELMALCDRLEADQADAEAAHAQLVQALLHSLTQATDAADFRASWQRLSEHFHTLFTTEASIDALKQTVLQLAVMGKLAAFDARPDEALATLPVLAAEDAPFELPTHWRWVRLGSLCNLVTSGSRGWKEFYADSGSVFIRSQDIKADKLEFDNKAFVQLPPSAEGARTLVAQDDLLITITGANVGKAAHIVEDIKDAYVSQHVALVRPKESRFSPYIHRWLVNSHSGRALLLASSYGAKPGLNLQNIKDLPVPLPPLAEQHRIVAKVDELMALCELTNHR
jgi:type I restriction enzyme S subunit